MKEIVSNHLCLDCGHLLTDHHQARGGWHNTPTWRGTPPRREACIGDYGRCPCKKFAHAHEKRIIVT